jgi:hypothetical protein
MVGSVPGYCNFQFQCNATKHYSAWPRCASRRTASLVGELDDARRLALPITLKNRRLRPISGAARRILIATVLAPRRVEVSRPVTAGDHCFTVDQEQTRQWVRVAVGYATEPNQVIA